MLLLFSGHFQRNASRSGAAPFWPQRPVAFSLHTSACEYSAPAGAAPFWPQPQKWPKTPLEPAGFKSSCAVGVRQKPVAAYPAKTQMLHIVVQRIAYDPLIAAAPTFRAVVRCSVAAQRRFLRCFVVFILFVMPPRVAPARLVDISVRLLMFSNLLTAPLSLP